MTAASDIAALAATDVREPIPMDKLIPVLSSPPFIPSRSLINMKSNGFLFCPAIRPILSRPRTPRP